MFDYLPYLAIAFVLVGISGQIITRMRFSSRTAPEPIESIATISDWRPTGKIDFGSPVTSGGDDAKPAPFYLRVEQYRILESFSGTKRIEIRWRNPTLREAKEITSRYNAASLPPRDLPPSVRATSIVPDIEISDENTSPNDHLVNFTESDAIGPTVSVGQQGSGPTAI